MGYNDYKIIYTYVIRIYRQIKYKNIFTNKTWNFNIYT